MNRTIRAAVISILWFAISTLPASSQTNMASVSGKISDPSGALIPGVTVTATNTNTKSVVGTVTSRDGKYGFSGLQPGSYIVLASLRGFTDASARKVLDSGESVELNLTISVATSDVILIRHSASSQTAAASVSGNISDPTGALIPGVTVTATNTDTKSVAKTMTNRDGTYGFSGLLPGTYNVLASLTGFKGASQQQVLGSGESVELNLKLTIGVAYPDDGNFVRRPPEGQIFR